VIALLNAKSGPVWGSDGSNGTAVLKFQIGNSDLNGLTLDAVLCSSVQMVLDNGNVFAIPGALRPVVI
jgi:hypothetical protein